MTQPDDPGPFNYDKIVQVDTRPAERIALFLIGVVVGMLVMLF